MMMMLVGAQLALASNPVYITLRIFPTPYLLGPPHLFGTKEYLQTLATCLRTFVVNSVKIVLLVFARDQGAILVLVPGPSLITCSSHSFDILFF